jgi:1-acyl-sn-glycerol-3-phosphate acyltransferase
MIDSAEKALNPEARPPMFKPLKFIVDVVVICLLWGYFLFGFALFFLPFYLAAFVVASNREQAFQKMNHRFFRSFLFLCRVLSPGLKVSIDDSIRGIQSSVIICNHLSYLDPLYMISLFERQKTIVKAVFFKVPLFGWLVRQSGYVPSNLRGSGFHLMIKHLIGMKDYLATGGNLFVFPEGTRSRDGRIGRFDKGIVGIAQRCRAPIELLQVRNTDKLFGPGMFLFNTCVPIEIEIDRLETITPDYESDHYDPDRLLADIEQVYRQQTQTE